MNTHHKTVLHLLPELTFYTQKIAEVHGANHPELLEIADLFTQIDIELRQHLKNEEEVLFPAIKAVLHTTSETSKATIISEITRMTGEHEFAGGAMDKINVLKHMVTWCQPMVATPTRVPTNYSNSLKTTYIFMCIWKTIFYIQKR